MIHEPTFRDLLLKPIRTVANVAKPNEDSASVRYEDYTLHLETQLLESGLHNDPNPDALWFYMGGFLISINSFADHIGHSSKFLGGYVIYQEFYITLLLCQNALTKNGRIRLSIFNFEIDTRAPMQRLNFPILLSTIQQDFPTLTKEDLQESFEFMKTVSVQREKVTSSNIEKYRRGEKLTYEVRIVKSGEISPPLTYDKHSESWMEIIQLGINGKEITSSKMHSFPPKIFQHDFQMAADTNQ